VPDRLVAPLLRAAQEAAGEGARSAAVVVLRCRGTLDGVREGLVDAYRREPSSRVAREIAEALEDLAHR
jgi:hypothetical protein